MTLPVPFIVGQHRSGTTLLRLMLDAHPDLTIPPETQFIPLAAEKCAGAADPAAAFIETLVSHVHWADFHLDADELERRVRELRRFDLSVAVRLFYELYSERIGKPRWETRRRDMSCTCRSFTRFCPRRGSSI